MKNNFHIFFCTLLFFLCIISCSKTTPEKVRKGNERAITITNKTGNKLSGYLVNVAGSGVEINKGVSSADSFAIIISDSFSNDTEIEVVLIDIYERIYAKTFHVPKTGNTDTPVTAGDRVSEGVLKDAWKDFIAWINTHQ